MPKPLANKLNSKQADKLFSIVRGDKSMLDKLTTFVKNTHNEHYCNFTYVELIVFALNANNRLIDSLHKGVVPTQYDGTPEENYLTAFRATYKEYINVCEQYGFKINLNIVGLSRLRRELHVLKEHEATQLVCKYARVKQQDVVVITTPTLTAIIDTLIDYGFVCKHVNTVEHIVKASNDYNYRLHTEYNVTVSCNDKLDALLNAKTSLLYVASGKNYCYVLVNNKNNTIVVDPDEYKQNCDVYFCFSVGTALSNNTSFNVIHEPF
jgi:hypothetical protein